MYRWFFIHRQPRALAFGAGPKPPPAPRTASPRDRTRRCGAATASSSGLCARDRRCARPVEAGLSNRNYSMISTTTPAPTVRPPSRMAKRSSFSIATGVISSTSISMWSPGITISVPSGSLMLPVTSVVRK